MKKIIYPLISALLALFAGYMLVKFSLEVMYATSIQNPQPGDLRYNETLGLPIFMLFMSIFIIVLSFTFIGDCLEEDECDYKFKRDPLWYLLKKGHKNFDFRRIILLATVVSFLLWIIAKFNDQVADWVIR